MIRFEKVSWEEYRKSYAEFVDEVCPCADIDEEAVRFDYDHIKLPERSTSGSAGYDFFAPFNFNVYTHDTTPVAHPTGIRFVTDRDDVFLACVPRSGLGFKHNLMLRNTLGVIDSDYQYSDNEGHIKVKMSACHNLLIKPGNAFMQGIILPFLKTDDDYCINTRNGGFGSTDKNIEVSSGKTE